ncbi:hypothetical protein NDU88_003440 [Pleurodeles waltl]|uniref:Uncharacterized protein n=1 Tax=Pleurodeles waltl TaxID=8319 RepID=A0AAV7M3E4_PLEWA|nr:hypothetical protein NDU88_003440 [Pleurodeles waltl]
MPAFAPGYARAQPTTPHAAVRYLGLVVLLAKSCPLQRDVGSSLIHPMAQADGQRLLPLGYLSLVVLLAPLSPAQWDVGSSLMCPMA